MADLTANFPISHSFRLLFVLVFAILPIPVASFAQEQSGQINEQSHSYSYLADLAGLLTAIATLATVGVILWQVRRTDKVAEGEFLLQLHKDFFFESNNAQIIKTIGEEKPILKQNNGQIEVDTLDNYLGMIELLAIFIDKKNMDAKTVDDMFGYYIVETWNNSEIQQYVKNVRDTQNNDDYYSGLEQLACKFKDT